MKKEQWISAMKASGIDASKQQFLVLILDQIQGKKQSEMLPAMLAAVNLARQKKISFSDDEIASFTKIMKKYLSAEEREKINLIQNIMRGMRH